MRRFFNSFIQIKRKPKLVLSFDGGGVRAIASIVFLKQLEIASGKKVFDVFGDLKSDFFIMKNLKKVFAPNNLLNPGRFIGKL